jgi:hypothetical protein
MSDRGAVHARYNASGDLEFFSTADPTAILLTIQANGTVTPLASSSAVAGVAASYAIARGQATTASASDTVATGLTTVVSAVAQLDDAPIVACEVATASIGDQAGAPAAGSILIQTWKTLGGTPVAATTFSKLVNWIAIGTKS